MVNVLVHTALSNTLPKLLDFLARKDKFYMAATEANLQLRTGQHKCHIQTLTTGKMDTKFCIEILHSGSASLTTHKVPQ